MTNTKPTHPSGLPPSYATARDAAENDEQTIDDLLTKTERLCAAATPGPWRSESCRMPMVNECGQMERLLVYVTHDRGEVVGCEWLGQRDADLIAHARTALPRLVAEVRSLEADLTELRAVRDRAANGDGMTTLEMKLVDGSIFVGYGIASRPDSLAYGKSEASDV